MVKAILGGLLLLLCLTGMAWANCTVTYSFTNGTTADANQVNTNFSNLTSCAAPLASPAFTGNVGIGIAPSGYFPLIVGTAGGNIADFDSTSTSGGAITVSNSGNANIYMGSAAAFVTGGAVSDGAIRTSLGNLVFAMGASEMMRLSTAGYLGVGTASPATPLYVLNSTGSLATFDSTNANGGYITVANSGTALGYFGSAPQLVSPGAAGDLAIRSSTGNLIFSMAATEVMRLSTAGYLGIATTSPAYPLTVNGTAYATGAAGALSDIRHKTNIASLGNDAVEAVMRLRPVTFNWKEPKDDGMRGRQTGFIAQEVEQVLPTVVLTQNNAEKTKGLKYNELIAVLTKAMQEQQAQISSLKAANDNNVAKITSLQGQLSWLERRIAIRTAQE